MNLAPVKPWESARGLAQSKTLTRCPGALDRAIASWSAPVLWRFTLRFRGFMRELFGEFSPRPSCLGAPFHGKVMGM